ncbi:hypothetical protein ACFWHT_12230 [Microbacterium sp. NPDC058342]|uniref:hypothetical protein n=1 Tax=Microbacterium sp. NPDC058342 TaxID=3346454 RepID=UPI0036468DD1
MRETAEVPGAGAPLRARSWRPWSSAWLWGVVLLGIALPWYLSEAGLDLLPYLLTLVGGWALGLSLVNLTLRLGPRLGLAVHVSAAVAFGVVLTWATSGGGAATEALPDRARAALFLLQMAAIPAAGWVWLALIGRASEAVRRPARPKRVPEWTREGDGSVVRFPAVRMPLRHLRIAVVVIVAVLGGVLLTLLIAFDAYVVGPKMTIILAGAVLGLPAYFALTAFYRRGTIDAFVRFDGGRMLVASGDERYDLSLADVTLLRWRTDSEEAHVEVRTAEVQISLIAGLARTGKDAAAALPPLPRHVLRKLELAGLTAEQGRAKGMTTWRRDAGRPGAAGA